VDSQGNVIAVGSFRNQVDLGGGSLVATGGRDGFVLGLAPDLTHRWSRRYGGGRDDEVSQVVVGPGGEIYLGGNFRETVDFDGALLTSSGSSDIFVHRITP
jgi:hypothetical protein